MAGKLSGTAIQAGTITLTQLSSGFNNTVNASYAQANSAYAQANAAYNDANTRLSATGGTISGNLIVSGNLTVSGNSTTLNTEILTVEDADIVLLSNVAGAPTLNSGITINRGSSTNTFIRWNESADKWGWSDDGSTMYNFSTSLDAYGQANAAYSAANNTVLKAGDTMTGQLNISAGGLLVTGNVNMDSGTLFVDSVNDRIGIGTTSPGSKFTVTNDIATGYSDINTLISGQWARISNPNTTSGVAATLLFEATGSGGGNGLGTISGVHTSNGSLALTFGTRNDSSNVTERVRIAANGNVGIGTTSPGQKLHVEGTAASDNLSVRVVNLATNGYSSIQLGDTNGGIYRNGSSQSSYAGNSSLNLITVGAHPIGFSTTNTLRMIIDGSGNVGIGTTSPGTKFHVVSTDSITGSWTRAAILQGPYPALVFHSSSSQNKFGGIGYDSGTNDGWRIWANASTSDVAATTPLVSILNNGNVGIGTTSPFSKFQVGSHTFSGGNGIYSNDRVGISVHGSLTSIMYASTYNDPTYPDYGLVFVHGTNTSNYNVWSLSPDGPAKGNSLNFIYGSNATNIHVTTPKVVFRGDGNVMIGHASVTCMRTGSISAAGALLSSAGRHIYGWYSVAAQSSHTYTHLKTSLWGGGSPYGNIEYIMGGFEITGYTYGNPANVKQIIQFHNWSGSVNHYYQKTSYGSYDPDNIAYVGSDGYVYIRLVAGQYLGYRIDLNQYEIYAVRDIRVTSVTNSNSATL